MNRYRYIIRRLLTAIPTFLGITALVYIVASLAPSSPLEILFNDPMATQEEMEEMSRKLGLDQPVVIQYLRWLAQLLQGNMGTSIFPSSTKTDSCQYQINAIRQSPSAVPKILQLRKRHTRNR